jgi:uncharacterized protein DUF2771
VTWTRRATALLAALPALAACGGAAEETVAPSVTVRVGEQQVSADPTQYCLAGEGRRYTTAPPILEVPADSDITLTVPDSVAEDGWSVQVFDEELEQKLGDVDVDPGTPVFDGINSSDVDPPAFYLVVVQRRDPDACEGLSGAWPIGFVRPGGAADPPAPATP